MKAVLYPRLNFRRLPDADEVLSSSSRVGLGEWDLWGPLLFCLALSTLLSICAVDSQKTQVFAGVFAMVWIGEAVVTAQIKLLGGNMWVCFRDGYRRRADGVQLVLSIRERDWVHTVSDRGVRSAERAACVDDDPAAGVRRMFPVELGGGDQHTGRQRSGPEPRRSGRVSIGNLLFWAGMFVLDQLGWTVRGNVCI